MSKNYQIIIPQKLEPAKKAYHDFALDVLIGLSESPKKLPSKYLYDTIGSEVFQEITELPEYYLTRCEHEILEEHKEEIAEIAGNEQFNLVELGPGDGRKTKVILEYFQAMQLDFQYAPIDISEDALKGLIATMNGFFPQLEIEGLVSDYFEGIKCLSAMRRCRNFVLFLGSNIGNFNPSETRVFLHRLWNALNHGDHVLIGFDLKKDVDMLLNAYNDSNGVTASFNLNLLNRINQEMGGNFRLDHFQHYETYDVFSGAMESYLVSKEAQSVYIEKLQQSFCFQAWEPIHTESSYKYLESDIILLAKETGFAIEAHFFDAQHYFADSLWRVEKVLQK
ncbi:MAG: L-histidine N(alpha)-methyltransferase [SAR324 cluster bacterium]|nr:L-histidine N(alpha)-methyltransferase [SAR324 cluster bacterium]